MSDILFFSKIVEETSEELGVSEKAIKAAYNNYVSYLQYIANYEPTLAIRIPYIGVIYIRQKYLQEEILLMQAGKKNNRGRLKAFIQKNKALTKWLKTYPNRPVMKYRAYNITRGRLKNKRITGGRTLTEIEEFQNKLADEKSR